MKVSNNLYAENYSQYLEEGLSAIPDKYMSKQPAIKGWNDYCTQPVSLDQAKQHLQYRGMVLKVGLDSLDIQMKYPIM
jgi:hypothetical protein